MLDHYIKGSCDRISPEAPVPIVDVSAEIYSLGGAGNVLKNLCALGCNGSLFSICGNDDEAGILEKQVSELLPSYYHLQKDVTRRTTIKTRVTVNRHQLIRLDKEDKHYCTNEIADGIIEAFKSRLPNIDVLIMSDYCKGVLSTYLVTSLLAICNANNITTIVDSKNKDLSKYHGASVIKPNRKEAILASGIHIVNDQTLKQACEKIAEVTACQTVVITLSEDGIAVYHAGELTTIPTKAIEVFDVTGAGDTVIAALSFALAHKMDIITACDLANHAAAVVVAKFGSAVATLDEIKKIRTVF